MLLEGAGLIDVGRADTPLVFTDPQSLSFHYLNVNHGAGITAAARHDLGRGRTATGRGRSSFRPSRRPRGRCSTCRRTVTLSAGGDTLLTAVARASADAAAGDDYGFIVLRKGDATRRIPYEFTVERPGLRIGHAREAQELPGRGHALGRRQGERLPLADRAVRPGGELQRAAGRRERRREALRHRPHPAGGQHRRRRRRPVAGSLIDPWFLGSRDENDVTGYTGTPVNVNSYLFDYRADVQAAGLQYPLQGRYYVAVDSGHSEFTGRSFAGRYLLHSWVNDVSPPLAIMITTTVAAGRPTIVARTLDLQAGVDPLSLVIAYGRVLVGAAAYDPVSGFAIFPLPASVAPLKAGRLPMVFAAGDFQEDKNVDQAGEIETILPNTTFLARTPAGRAAADRAVALPGAEGMPRRPGTAAGRRRARRGRPARSSSASTASRSRPTGPRPPGSTPPTGGRPSSRSGRTRLRALVTDAAGKRAAAPPLSQSV